MNLTLVATYVGPIRSRDGLTFVIHTLDVYPDRVEIDRSHIDTNYKIALTVRKSLTKNGVGLDEQGWLTTLQWAANWCGIFMPGDEEAEAVSFYEPEAKVVWNRP